MDTQKMENAKKRLILFTAALIIIAGMSGCSEKEAVSTAGKTSGKEEKSVSQDTLELKQEVYSFRVEGFNKDRKSQWGLEGASANVLEDKINIKGLKAVYLGEDATFTVFADKAVYDKATRDIELKENILGKSSNGGELITAYAKWNAATEEITTPARVLVKRENIKCKGKGMVTWPHLEKVRFREEVTVTIAPDKKITCDGPFELDHRENTAIFNKNVRITEIDSETLTDKLTVYLNPDTNEIERVVTEGNVEIVHKGDKKDIGKMSF